MTGRQAAGTLRRVIGSSPTFFKLLGVFVAAYVAYGLATGAVYARSGLWGRTFRRGEDAFGYWSAIVAYSILAAMLLVLF